MMKINKSSNNGSRKQTVLMFPWLGHGHVSPFLELSKSLSNTNLFNTYLCSTSANLDSVKKTLTTSASSIRLIELKLPTLPDLPPHLHTTNGLPLHLMPTLKQAFDLAIPQFSRILIDLKPDLLIYDIIQPWAPMAAAALGVPSVVFITTSAAASMYHQYLNTTNKGIVFPFSSKIFYRTYEDGHESKRPAVRPKEKDRVMECVGKSSSIVLVKSFEEIEGKYADYLSFLTNKKIVAVGPLVADPTDVDMKQNAVIQWLDSKATGSTIFVSFGSEYFVSSVDMKEIAYGLGMSNVNFIWVLRFPKGEDSKTKASAALPLGFAERVKNRGLIVDGWAPQAKKLGHKNLGGFVSHCGWSSVLEAMKFGVPIIAMPMQLDQPINARLAVEVGVGVGVEVVREENGRLKRETVVVSKSGEAVREKAKKLGADLKLKGDKEMDVAADELLQLCKSGGGNNLCVGSGSGLRKTKSDAFPIGAHLCFEGRSLVWRKSPLLFLCLQVCLARYRRVVYKIV